MSTAQTQPSIPFLDYARTSPDVVIEGTIPSGVAGGNTASNVIFNPSSLPSVPAWASAIDVNFSIPVSVSVPAGAIGYVSPYAPYSGVLLGLSLAGSNAWPNEMSLVPWWLDQITSGQSITNFNKIAGATVLNGGALTPTYANTSYGYYGPNPGNDSINGYLPGSEINNSAGTSALVVAGTLTGSITIQLQRKRSVLWGCLPLGDTSSKVGIKAQLAPIVGNQLEGSLVQDPKAAGITGVTTGVATVNCIFRSLSTDVIPAAYQQDIQSAKVDFALNVDYSSIPVAGAGSIDYVAHRTAMLYTQIHQITSSSGLPVNPDYIGLWLTEQIKSARYSYDASAGNLQNYYDNVLNVYQRFLPSGHVIYDLDRGDYPAIPKLTPYLGVMSPDSAYAAAAKIQPTPAMSTAYRIPAGTTIENAYISNYAFGLVKVPF